jgi:hypothetical protein
MTVAELQVDSRLAMANAALYHCGCRMRLRSGVSLCVLIASPVFAQDPGTLPLPITSPRAVQPGTPPLTASEKARLALKNVVGPSALVNRALLAGYNHWMDHPEEWSGNLDGYAQRYASRWTRLAVRHSIQLSADIAFKTDPRYDRCDCTGFRARTGHAIKRVFVQRRDNGGEMISVSRLAGAYVTPMITDQWYPDRLNTWSHKMQSGSMFLGWRAAHNFLKEFWPEITRPLKRNRNQKGP